MTPLNTTQRQIRIRYDEHFDATTIGSIKSWYGAYHFNLPESFDLRTFIKRENLQYQIYKIKCLK